VKNVSEKITASKAKELGLTACKICKPPDSGEITSTNKAKGENSTVQCKGTLKAGTRCKHQTSIANGYCYQHQPK